MKPIHIVHYVSKNLGDSINDLIFSYFIGECTFGLKFKKDNINLLGVGSIMALSNNTEVCGSGIISLNQKNEIPKKIHWVRGPMTRDILLKEFNRKKIKLNIPKIYGDAALLLPFIIKSTVSKKYRVGFIPHYIDRETNLAKKIINLGAHFIDIYDYNSYQSFIDEINSCHYIISSSLHGIIISDAYNIPSYHVVLSNKVIGGKFKFMDYYSSVGREYNTINLEKLNDLNDLTSQFKEYKCNINLAKIIDIFPHIKPEVKEESLKMLKNGFMDYINNSNN